MCRTRDKSTMDINEPSKTLFLSFDSSSPGIIFCVLSVFLLKTTSS